MEEAIFIRSALANFGSNWDNNSLIKLSSLHVPDSILGQKRFILRSDINEQWARWFVESLADPRYYIGLDFSYPRLFSDVLQNVSRRFGNSTKSEKQELASVAARILQNWINNFQSERKRQHVTDNEKRLLIDLAGDYPRCWICGNKFAEESIDNFLKREQNKIPLPVFIDILKPRGLKQRDLSIEIDHVVPYSHGGTNEDNLKLACGWCNRYKSNFTSIYDIDGRPLSVKQNNTGIKSLPQPFWTVRLLAIGRRCEHPDGCEVSADHDAVTVTPIMKDGAMNPSNLRITCYVHDPIREMRLQSKNIVLQVWGYKE